MFPEGIEDHTCKKTGKCDLKQQKSDPKSTIYPGHFNILFAHIIRNKYMYNWLKQREGGQDTVFDWSTCSKGVCL